MSAALRPQRHLPGTGRISEDRNGGYFRVARDAFTDRDVFERERAAIFDRCWLYLGHESELRAPNDFLTRNFGGRSIIFNRDRTGEFHAFMNTCPHRGAPVAREKTGNAIAFKCFYHGWAFNNNGQFASRFAEGIYPADFNKDGCANLAPAPRLDNYRGLYFVNFDRNAETLSEYLGPKLMNYLDVVLDQSPEGMEIAGGTQEYAIRANWKLLAENSYDGYHAAETHSTYLAYLMDAIGGPLEVSPGVGAQARAHDLGHGHALVEYPAPWGRPVAQYIPAWGEKGKADIAALRAELEARLGPERAAQIAALNRNIVIFPNLVINDIMAITVRTFFPLAPDHMEVNAWSMSPVGEDALFRKRRFENFLEFLGPGGFATPDDVEALEGCQSGYRNAAEAGWNDLSRGMLKKSGWAADDEEHLRCFWREWDRRMGGA